MSLLNNDNNSVYVKLDNKKSDSFLIQDAENITQNKKFQFFLKFLVFILANLFLILGRLYAVPDNYVQCILDPIHDSSKNINNTINNNKSLAKFLQISSSLLMDITFFVLFIYWVFYIKNCRLVLVTPMFYIIRAFSQMLVQFTFPQGFYWEYPGFPSYVVPYGRTSDFFFSGHAGFLTICALEWYSLKKYKMSIVTTIILVYMIFILIIFRTHYTIDITTGIFMAHYCHLIVDRFHLRLDAMFKKVVSVLVLKYVKIKVEEKKPKESQKEENVN